MALKKVIYRRLGEPYVINGQTLRFAPGTRPVRLRYVESENDIVCYDALQVQLLTSELAEGDLAIDVGTHAGQYCILMADRCGQSGRVIAFEPDPYARQKLFHNLSLNPTIKRPEVEAFAVSDAAGDAVLFSGGGNAQSSLVRSGVEFSTSHRSEQVPVSLVSLDQYLSDRYLPPPQWVKIDAEGAEIRILKGAANLLKGQTRVVCELHPYAWPEFKTTFDELKNLVDAAGRRIRYLDQDCEISGQPRYGAVLLEPHS